MKDDTFKICVLNSLFVYVVLLGTYWYFIG